MANDNNAIVNLQATLSAASASVNQVPPFPHHPVTCSGELRFNEDNSFECDHARAEPGNERTQHCITHSIALLLINLAREL